MTYGGGTVECPNCGDEVDVAKSEFRYVSVSHKRSCDVWLKIDRYENEVVGVEQ
jgi:uncharacterized Zn finger protein (UPF0148 family)